jgi:peroxiredoxin
MGLPPWQNPLFSLPKKNLKPMRALFFIALIAAFFAACENNNSQTPANNTTTASTAPVDYGPALDIEEYKKQCETPEIKVTVDGLNGGVAYLIGVFADQNFRADSAIINNKGEFVFEEDKPYAPGLYYIYLPNKSSIQIIVDKDQKFSLHTSLVNLSGNLKVEGSLDNELFVQVSKFEEQMRPRFSQVAAEMRKYQPGTPDYNKWEQEQYKLIDERMAYLKKIADEHPESFFVKFKMAGQNPDIRNIKKPDGTLDTVRYAYLYRTKFWDDVDFSDTRLMYTPVLANKLKRYITQLTPQHPDSINAAANFLVDKTLGNPEIFKYFANWIVLNYDPKESTLMDAQAVFVNMIQRYFTYDRAFWSDSAEVHAIQLRAYEMAASLVGKKGPNVTAPGPDGKTYSIYDIKDPYIIVYMYNPDCEHCAVETPKLVRWYQEWHPKGVEVYAIAVDTDDAKWKAYIKKNNMPWPYNVFDPTNKSIYAKYYVDVTPEIYVLNPERIIIGKNLKVDQIATIINRDKQKRK